jgi:hypothetical protein
MARLHSQSDETLRIVTSGFQVEFARGAVSRRPPISLDTMVPRNGGYTYDVGVWDLSIEKGQFLSPVCQTLTIRFATLSGRRSLNLWQCRALDLTVRHNMHWLERVVIENASLTSLNLSGLKTRWSTHAELQALRPGLTVTVTV